MSTLAIGKTGENAAFNYLKKHRYKILERNFRKPFGELDIVARKGDTVVFVEVKTRHGNEFGLPCESVTPAKQRRIVRAAYAYISENGIDANYRFDIIEVYHTNGKPEKLRHIQNAFEGV